MSAEFEIVLTGPHKRRAVIGEADCFDAAVTGVEMAVERYPYSDIYVRHKGGTVLYRCGGKPDKIPLPAGNA
jgi:hypothetical protein